MTTEEPGVYISSAQMYTELRSLHDAVARVDSKLQVMAAQSAMIADHEHRLRAMERRVWTASGAAAGLGGLGGWLLQHLAG